MGVAQARQERGQGLRRHLHRRDGHQAPVVPPRLGRQGVPHRRRLRVELARWHRRGGLHHHLGRRRTFLPEDAPYPPCFPSAQGYQPRGDAQDGRRDDLQVHGGARHAARGVHAVPSYLRPRHPDVPQGDVLHVRREQHRIHDRPEGPDGLGQEHAAGVLRPDLELPELHGRELAGDVERRDEIDHGGQSDELRGRPTALGACHGRHAHLRGEVQPLRGGRPGDGSLPETLQLHGGAPQRVSQ
mmetsp:Transcript_14990/g.44930  ORF Transcript_14990/g.44930 Transcript_14990/m.44930 type:complete len:243 (-) Transcript_14990:2580-3308(-)